MWGLVTCMDLCHYFMLYSLIVYMREERVLLFIIRHSTLLFVLFIMQGVMMKPQVNTRIKRDILDIHGEIALL